MNVRPIGAVLVLFAAIACSKPLQFADWTIPIPEGTRIIEYAHVLVSDRSGRIGAAYRAVVSGRVS